MPPKKAKKEVTKAEVPATTPRQGRSKKVKSPSPPPQKVNKKETKKAGKQKQPSPSPPKQTESKKGSKRKAPSPVKTEAVKKAKVEEEEPKVIRKVVTKGGAAVDHLVPNKDAYHVLQKNGKSYAATLNQSNIGHNNNKFYIIQVLQSDSNPNIYYAFNRWGRVGVDGQQCVKGPFGEAGAISDYESKLRDKLRGGYTEIHINYEEDDKEEEPKKGSKRGSQKASNEPKKESTLHPRLQALINMIFDMKMMDNTMKEIGYDPKKMPLGKLAEQTIKEGYQVLSDLQQAIKDKKGKATYDTLSSRFYSLIPHDFGFKPMHLFSIDTDEKVRQKLEMLQTLTDMKIATKLLKGGTDSQEDLLDQNYKKLSCDLKPVSADTEKFKLIQQFIDDGKEHYRPKIVDVFEIDRTGEKQRYDTKVGNDMLLWHGSRVSNFVGILSQGLRIAPPEAPVSGYNYGKGIYFADIFGKSANYCRADTSNGEILIMLVEVAVGKPNVLQRTDYNAQNLPAGTHSTFGWGTMGPPEKSHKKLDGVTIPLGKPERTKSNHYMGHNEYIVYNLNQARLKYLIRAKIN